jgi:hypothetical protein
MKNSPLRLGILLCFVLITACTSQASATPVNPTQPAATEIPSSQPSTSAKPLETVEDFPAATSVALTTAGDIVYMITGREHSLYVLRSMDGGQTFTEPVSPTGNQSAHVLRVERPAISANEEGKVAVAWLELDLQGGNNKVWYAQSIDGGQTFESARLVSEEPSGETVMVQVLLAFGGNPILTWLSGNHLRFARSTDGGESFSPATEIGKGACECCQPAMLEDREQLRVAYRGMDEDETGAFRDAALIRSLDGGETFGPVSFVTDSHWYINACPISGPSIATRDENIYLTWMDGRAVAPDNLMSSDVWFAASSDDGQTFSSNVKVNADTSTHNFLPVMAVGPGGRIHLAWQALTVDAIYYATSDDNGQTFIAPQLIAADERGRPAVPSMVIDTQRRVYLAWLDDSGLRLAVWEDTN